MRYATNTVSAFSAVRKQPVAKRSLELNRRHIRQVIILFAIAMSFSLLFVWTRVRVIQLGYEVSRMRKEVSDLSEQKSLLEAEVASLRSPKRLEGIARKRFGMRLPQGDEIVFVKRRSQGGVRAEVQDR